MVIVLETIVIAIVLKMNVIIIVSETIAIIIVLGIVVITIVLEIVVIAIVLGTIVIVMVLGIDRKSTRLNSSHANISYAVFCLKKKTTKPQDGPPQRATQVQ